MTFFQQDADAMNFQEINTNGERRPLQQLNYSGQEDDKIQKKRKHIVQYKQKYIYKIKIVPNTKSFTKLKYVPNIKIHTQSKYIHKIQNIYYQNTKYTHKINAVNKIK